MADGRLRWMSRWIILPLVPRGSRSRNKSGTLPTFLLAGIVDGGDAGTAPRVPRLSTGRLRQHESHGVRPMKLTDVAPNLIVADTDRSISFYRDVLGFSVVTTVPDAPPFVFAWMQRDGVNVFLNSLEGMEDDIAGLTSREIGGTATMFFTLERNDAGGIDE